MCVILLQLPLGKIAQAGRQAGIVLGSTVPFSCSFRSRSAHHNGGHDNDDDDGDDHCPLLLASPRRHLRPMQVHDLHSSKSIESSGVFGDEKSDAYPPTLIPRSDDSPFFFPPFLFLACVCVWNMLRSCLLERHGWLAHHTHAVSRSIEYAYAYACLLAALSLPRTRPASEASAFPPARSRAL